MSNTRIAFIGAGNMAASLIGGLRAKGLEAAHIRASDPGEETRAKVSAEHGIGQAKLGELARLTDPVRLHMMQAVKKADVFG
jgi:pyrroline-5-carboxylate reductase